MATTESENREIVRQCNEGLLEGNLEVIEEHIADDFVGHSGAAPGPVHGQDGFREFFSVMQTAFPDMEVTVEDVVAKDDKVVLRRRFTGTHEGEFKGIEPTGNEVEFESIAIGRIEDGQIAEFWGQPDMLGLMQQLGVVEPPSE